MNKKASQFLVLFYVCLLLSACGTKSTEIQISAPLRPKYVAQGYKKLYIADFIITGVKDVDRETRNVNVNKEIKETLKSEFKDKSGYEIDDLKLEVPADRKPEDVLRDPQFWATQNIPNRDSSMIMAGVVEFSNHAKSGLVTEQVVNPRTGTERTITSPKDQLQLVLSVNLFLVDAQHGDKLFEETFKEEQVYDDVSNVSLPLFYDVFDRMAPKIVGVLVSYRVSGSRTLLEP
ncbi:MAG: hypothetical protein C5B54_04960 [Acidobacteria bacterium]|nr:MAG: hypothetical protein C5B54_04960 [Acidobacteriota bacterium]